MKRTLGIDQSYTSCGYCMHDENGVMLDFGTFKSAKAMDIYDRAIQVANFVCEKVEQHNPTNMNIEGLAFGIRGDATRDLAGLLFTIITTMRKRGLTVEVKIIAPTSLKKFATKTGKSDKSAMTLAVPTETLEKFKEANYKKTTGLTDIVDAYWLSKYE